MPTVIYFRWIFSFNCESIYQSMRENRTQLSLALIILLDQLKMYAILILSQVS